MRGILNDPGPEVGVDGLEERPECFPNGFGHDLFACIVGMDPIALVEGRVAAYAVEEEGDEGGLILCREPGEDLLEIIGIGGTHAWGDAHSGEDDLTGRVMAANGVDDRLEVVTGAVNGDTAEAVVGAELEDEDVSGLAQGPVDPALSVGGCFAADACVDDLVWQVEGVDAAADDGGESLIGVEAVAGGEAVTEEDDGFSVVGRGDRWACRGGGAGGMGAVGWRGGGSIMAGV
jgi:hypothetical protein